MGMSRRAYAALRGVSHTAVNKAIAVGRITLEEDGTIDPVKADAQWAANTDPALQRGPESQPGSGAGGQPSVAPGMKAVPTAAIKAVSETLKDEGEPEPDPAGGGQEVSFVRARMANEVLKAQTARVKLQRLKGELVDRAKATAFVFELARKERDAWQAWPPRVAANMAAELRVDAHALEKVLDSYLRRQLSELAEIRVELR